VVCIGAGPAGLTAGYLLSKEGVRVTVLEQDPVYVGGISKTPTYKGFSFDIGGHRTGSTDMGDIAHMIPVIHPYVASALGKTHGADFRINEPEHAYLTPAKLLAMTAIDLLWDDAAPARQVISEFKPAFTKDEYLAFERGLFKKEHYRSEA